MHPAVPILPGNSTDLALEWYSTQAPLMLRMLVLHMTHRCEGFFLADIEVANCEGMRHILDICCCCLGTPVTANDT